MRRDVAEARDLRRLRRQVHDRVEDEVRDGERPVHRRRREVADRHADVLAARLRAQPRDHRPRQLDAVHRHPSLRERERDPARADPELERAPAPGQLGEEVDGRVDDRRVEHVRGGLVVPGGDPLVEVAVSSCTARTYRRAGGAGRRSPRPRRRRTAVALRATDRDASSPVGGRSPWPSAADAGGDSTSSRL